MVPLLDDGWVAANLVATAAAALHHNNALFRTGGGATSEDQCTRWIAARWRMQLAALNLTVVTHRRYPNSNRRSDIEIRAGADPIAVFEAKNWRGSDINDAITKLRDFYLLPGIAKFVMGYGGWIAHLNLGADLNDTAGGFYYPANGIWVQWFPVQPKHGEFPHSYFIIARVVD